MQLFTSERELRLWLWVLTVVLAIYSILGPAGTRVAYLCERGLLWVSDALGQGDVFRAGYWHHYLNRDGMRRVLDIDDSSLGQASHF
jgi:hypothetical protein